MNLCPLRGTSQSVLLEDTVQDQVEWLRLKKPASIDANPSSTNVLIYLYLNSAGSKEPFIRKDTNEEYFLEILYDKGIND